jgi:hypothetical protein
MSAAHGRRLKGVLMRACLRTAALLVLCHGPIARAQDATPSNLIDFNPGTLLWGEVSLEYERALGQAMSVLIGPQLLPFKGVIDNSYASQTGIQSKGAGLTLSFHFFPGVQSLRGFWIGPEADATWASASVGNITVSGTVFGVYGIAGYTFLPGPNVAISLGIGAGRRLNSVTGTDASGNTVVELGPGWVVTGRAAIGYAF